MKILWNQKICNALFLLFIVGMLAGCASPGGLRKYGVDFIFKAPKGTTLEFGRCLINQFDEKYPAYSHILREKNDGNITVIGTTRIAEQKIVFDINKEDKGLNILVYSEWFQNQSWHDWIYPYVVEVLNTCGATEKLQ